MGAFGTLNCVRTAVCRSRHLLRRRPALALPCMTAPPPPRSPTGLGTLNLTAATNLTWCLAVQPGFYNPSPMTFPAVGVVQPCPPETFSPFPRLSWQAPSCTSW